jgi:predicted O-methyltransferase YrrM
VARENLERAGVAGAVELRVGPALETLTQLEGPFDLVFIDADKRSNPEYLGEAVRLSRPGTLIVADNVVRAGAVADPGADDPSVTGVRRFLELVSEHPRLDATAIQTVGSKGWDGFVLALVR